MTEIAPLPAEAGVPALVSARGAEAEMRYLEFLVARIRNRNTRRAYAQAFGDFAAFAEARGIWDLAAVRPAHVGPGSRPCARSARRRPSSCGWPRLGACWTGSSSAG
jgi:hypothetical protein